MKQEERQILLKDLSARLPHKVIVEIISYTDETSRPWFGELSCKDLDCFIHDVAYKSIKPYLRPMSSMTEEERNEYYETMDKYTHRIYPNSADFSEHTEYSWTTETFDFLNAHHFDYHGLIPMGLAIEASKGMYKMEE